MSNANKSEKNIDSSDDILDSYDLFDLDMPIDEPGEDEPADASAESLEKELEQLLERDEPDSFQAPEQLADTDNPRIDSANTETTMPPLPEPASIPPAAAPSAPAPDSAAPDAPQGNKKGRPGLANSLMFTLGLVAILVASLAAWLGLDASGKITNLEKMHPLIQQHIKALEQQQKQQNRALNSQIETMQQQIDTLTKVVANKATEQWRAALEKENPAQKKPRSTAQHATVSPDVASKQASKPEAKQSLHPVAANIAEKPMAKPVLSTAITPAKTVHTPRPTPAKVATVSAALARHEVAPGSVKGWVVNIYSVESQDTAERQIRQLEGKDIHAEYVRVPVKGKVWYRIRVSGFKNKRAAMVFNKFLKEYHGIEGTWYQKLK